MKKEKKISEDFQEIFISNKIPKEKNETNLSRANETYNRLVSKGIIKKRGYTLRGIEDTHLFHFSKNDLNSTFRCAEN